MTTEQITQANAELREKPPLDIIRWALAQAGGRVRVGGFPSSAFVAPSGNATNADNNDSSTRTVRAGSGSGRIYVNSGSDDVDIDQEG